MTHNQSSPVTSGLLPCPFCGKQPAECILEDEIDSPASAWINCSCGVETIERPTLEEAAAHWNTRAPLQAATPIGGEDDRLALDAAYQIEALPSDLHEAQKTARIQLIVLDAMRSAPSRCSADTREAIAFELWQRFAPVHHIGWTDETHKAEYYAAADGVLSAIPNGAQPARDEVRATAYFKTRGNQYNLPQIVGPIQHNDDGECPWCADVGGEKWIWNAAGNARADNEPHPRDLMEIVTVTTSPISSTEGK